MGVKLDNLVVVNFPDRGKGSVPEFVTLKKNRLFIPDTCTRHMLVTTKEDWEAHVPKSLKDCCMTNDEAQKKFGRALPPDLFTRSQDPIYHVEYGEKAYAELLRIISGLDSVKTGEEAILGQFIEDWKEFKLIDNIKAQLIESPVTAVIGDAKAIHANVIQGRCKPSRESSAKKLSNSGKGHGVTVIASDSLEETKKMLNAIGKQHKDSVMQIDVLHPNAEKAELLRRHIDVMKTEGEIGANCTCNLEVLEPENLQLAFDMSNAIFVIPPLGKTAKLDDMIRTAWQERSADAVVDAKIVFNSAVLDGQFRNEALNQWAKLKDKTDHIVLPMDITAHNIDAEHNFEGVVQNAHNAIVNCLASHAKNKHVIGQALSLPPDEYAQKLVKPELGSIKERYATRQKPGEANSASATR